MRKRMLAMLLVLILLPVTAMAELEFHRETKRFINFPSMDEWRGHFNKIDHWTIVTPDNLEEHLDLVLQRGDSEEEIRERFAQEGFLFEAYSTDLPTDACFRVEMYENDLTREVWHLKHLGSAERQELNQRIEAGYVLPDRDVYALSNKGSNDSACINGYFTNYPPLRHESGQIQFRFRNGRMYVFSYCVSGRLAGRSRWYTNKEADQFSLTPMSLTADSAFKSKALPRLPKFTLDETFPVQVDLGDVTVTGTIEKGSTITAALDGAPLDVQVDKKTSFSVTLPLTEPGDHEVVFTVSNKKFTERVQTYTVNASGNRTPLTLTEQPEIYPLVGEQVFSGTTAPGATLRLILDEGEEMTVIADESGAFTCSFLIEDSAMHTVEIMAEAEGRDAVSAQVMFYTQYESVKDGIKAFSGKLTEHRIDTMSGNPGAYTGERVKISVRIKEVTFNEQGLGLLCEYNPPNGLRHDETPLYLTVPGYAQCQLHENMIITVYGTVEGERVIQTDAGEETRMEIFVEYGTYMTYK